MDLPILQVNGALSAEELNELTNTNRFKDYKED